MLIRSGEAPAIGWSRNMLYSGFITLHRSGFWSAYLNGRSDNLGVIQLLNYDGNKFRGRTCMPDELNAKQVSLRGIFVTTTILCLSLSTFLSPHQGIRAIGFCVTGAILLGLVLGLLLSVCILSVRKPPNDDRRDGPSDSTSRHKQHQ